MPLTATKILAAKPREKAYKLTDGRGLYVEVTPSGGRLWRWRYRFDGSEKSLSLGDFRDLPCDQARAAVLRARLLLKSGVDPSAERAAAKVAAKATAARPTFGVVAREWFKLKSRGWADSHSPRLWRRLERDVLPYLGRLPLAEIDAPMILEVLRRVEKRGNAYTAKRERGYIGEIFLFAIAKGEATHNPAADLVRALEATAPVSHMAAVTDKAGFGKLLRQTDSYPGSFVVASALKLAPRLFVRPGELRHAKWADVDLDAARWSFTASKTKMAMIVPLSTQVVAILRELHDLTGRGVYVFPSARGASRPMSENAVLFAMRDIGIEKEVMTGHGFRASARTLLDEELKFPAHLIEAQLGHAVRDANGRAYNRTSHLDDRIAMMQRWSDYLDEIKNAAS